MSLLFFTLSYIFFEIFVGGFFFIFKIKLNSIFFLRLHTRYLSVKSPVRFDFWGLFNIKLSIFIVFRNIKLHFFFYFSYFLTLRYEIFDSKIAFYGSDATVILLQHISDDRHMMAY